MRVVTAICPRCGNEPENETVCEDCGYDGKEGGWIIQELHFPPPENSPLPETARKNFEAKWGGRITR